MPSDIARVERACRSRMVAPGLHASRHLDGGSGGGRGRIDPQENRFFTVRGDAIRRKGPVPADQTEYT